MCDTSIVRATERVIFSMVIYIFWRSLYRTNSPPIESILNSWHQVCPPSFTTSIAAINILGITPVFDRRPTRPPAKPPLKMRFSQIFSSCMRGYVLLLFVAVCLVRAGCPEWSGSRVRIACPCTPPYVYLLVKKRQLCCCASRCRT